MMMIMEDHEWAAQWSVPSNKLYKKNKYKKNII